MKNVSLIEMLIAHLHYWINFTKMLQTISETYENSFSVLIRVLKQEFPVDCVLKNGKHLSLRTFNAMFFIAYSQDTPEIQYDVEDDIVIIPPLESITDKEVKLYGGVNNGDIVYGFLKGDYSKLPVMGKTVIDVGSNIGDTPIYFSIHGAKRVIGLEPFPKNYELAKKNASSNNLSDKITLILAGCASQIGQIVIDPEYGSNIESQLVKSSKGTTIPLLTLQEIVKKYDVPDDSILKMDCEGCEYESIISAPDTTLQRFSHILIEYHTGYKNLKEKLERCGFKVTVSTPRATDVINTYLQSLQTLIKSSKKRNNINNLNRNGIESNSKKHHKIGYSGFIYGVR
ncbi:MAG: FkbM family methyltransferase [Thaumarchaeota archaeon]|nr:FkbM family methyltransferase [Nitrososphaerota archaeon]